MVSLGWGLPQKGVKSLLSFIHSPAVNETQSLRLNSLSKVTGVGEEGREATLPISSLLTTKNFNPPPYGTPELRKIKPKA